MAARQASPCQPLPTRACGAIALVNVLRQLGIARNAEQICRQVAMPDPFGTQAARSYRLAAYAISCGLGAVTLQCHSGRWLDALQYACEQNVSVILNHQAAHAPDEGHYSVLGKLNHTSVVLNDPFKGPGQRVSLERMQSWWQPNLETVGHTLIAIGRLPGNQIASNLPDSPTCPGCGTHLSLFPSQMFVQRDWDTGGLWHRFFCHGCDASFTPSG